MGKHNPQARSNPFNGADDLFRHFRQQRKHAPPPGVFAYVLPSFLPAFLTGVQVVLQRPRQGISLSGFPAHIDVLLLSFSLLLRDVNHQLPYFTPKIFTK